MTCPIRHNIRPPLRRSRSWENKNLNLGEDGQERIGNGDIRGPRSNDQQRAHRIKDTGFNEHGDDGFAQSTDSSYSESGASVPGVQ